MSIDISGVTEFGIALVDPKELKIRPPFSDLFPINPAVRDAIRRSMQENGFDGSKPINVWRRENVVVDGHTRKEVAEELGLDVAVFFHGFETEDEAFEYAVANQRNRRNLADADFVRLVAMVDTRKQRGGDRRSEDFKPPGGGMKSSAEKTAALVGISPRKVERIRTVQDHAPEEIREAVEEGRMTVNRAYAETQKKRKESSPGSARKSSLRDSISPKQRAVPVMDGGGESTIIIPTHEELGRIYQSRAWTEEEQSYLDSLPSKSRFPGRKFEEDAILYRRIAPLLRQIASEINDAVGPRSEAGATVLYGILIKFVDIPPVSCWEPCRHCGNSGSPCRKCRGGGFVIPGF